MRRDPDEIIVAQEGRTLQAQTERAAQKSRIAEAVQRGKLDTLTLWAAVRGYAAKKALRWVAALHHRCGVELDDLMQEAYLAMLRTAFADVCGLRTMRNRNDPLQTAVSLDTPVGEDGEETNALVDFVQDTQAEDRLLEIEREELVEAVQAALQQLPNELREALTDVFWYDKPVDARLRNTALKALRTPTVCQTLRTYV